MTTKITLWGTQGRIFADRQECQVFLRDTAEVPDGLPRGLERQVHDRTHRPGVVLPARRGVQRAARCTSSQRVGAGDVEGHNNFASAADDRPDRCHDGRRDRDADPRTRRRRPALDAIEPRRSASTPDLSADVARRSRLRRRRRAPAGRGDDYDDDGAVAMDRLLFGDNQFFGVNHMSEEKARAQPMRFQDIERHAWRCSMPRTTKASDLHVHDARPDRAGRRSCPRRPRAVPATSLLPVHAVRAQVRERDDRGRACSAR